MNAARHLFKPSLASNLPLGRGYAFKSDLKIKWNRPEKIPCIMPEKSGDLVGIPKLDLSQPQFEFRNCKELETANETVKKLFSLEYASRKKLTQMYCYEMKEMVKRHEMDVGSVEVQIARWTGIIRAYQEVMERFPRNKIIKVVLKEMIDRRKKKLKYLRQWDYKRFEWLLEKLNLVYKPPPGHFHWVTRKESLRKLTDQHCEDIKKERLENYKKILQEEQPSFLKEKIRALEFIRNEQIECKAAITVTEEEIEQVKRKLEELEKKKDEE